MRFLSVLIICLFSLSAQAAKIDRTEINNLLKQIKSQPLLHDAQTGIWLDPYSGEIVLDLLENKLRLALDIIDDRDEQLKVQKGIADNFIKIIGNYEYVMKEYTETVDKTLEKITHEIEIPWYKKPAFMYAYGVATATVVFGVSVYTLDKVR